MVDVANLRSGHVRGTVPNQAVLVNRAMFWGNWKTDKPKH
jgi:hypothetical protein